MELKEFIKIALIDLINAVDEAQDLIEGQAHAIVPQIHTGAGKEAKYVQNVECDIAVQVAREGSTGGQAKLVIPFVELGFEGGKPSKDISSTLSRIRFTIPVAFGFVEKSLRKRTEERPKKVGKVK